MMTRGSLDLPQWRVFFKEDYTKDTSVFIIKVHHTMCDGHGLILYVNSLTDEPQDLMAQVRNPSIFKKALLYLTVPFYFLKMSYLVLTQSYPNNPLHRGQPNSGVKSIISSRDFHLPSLKAKCKENECTVNDVIMSSISVTLKEYFLRQGDERTHSVFVGLPVNLRGKPKNKGDFHFGNIVGAFPLVMPLFTDIKKALKYFHRATNIVKFTGAPFAMIAFTKLLQTLSFAICSQIMNLLCSKCSLIISNSLGPAQPFIFNGQKSTRISVPLPPLCDVPGGFAILSHQDIIKISMTLDESKCKEPKAIMEAFEKNLENFITN